MHIFIKKPKKMYISHKETESETEMPAEISDYCKRCMSLLCFVLFFTVSYPMYENVISQSLLETNLLSLEMRVLPYAFGKYSGRLGMFGKLAKSPNLVCPKLPADEGSQTRTDGRTAAQCGFPQFFSLFSSHSPSVRRKKTQTRDLS